MTKISHNHAGRREFLLAGAAATLGIAYHGIPVIKAADLMTHHAGLQDPPGTHGMLLFGEKKIYLSHLPMFSIPVHRYQVILEVTLTKASGDAQAAYVKDRRQHPATRIYTFEPDPFILPELDPANPQRNSFTGTIFRGHFERGGKPINENVTANVTRVVHFRKFDPAAAGLPQLEYFLFGNGPELFLAHLITKPPDFDQIVPVVKTNSPFTAEALGRGVPITFPGKLNKPARRIRASPQVIGQAKKADGSLTQVKLQTRTEMYFEAGELAE
jgi:hypothetical protein